VSVEIGRRVAAQVEKGLSVDQIVAIAKALEVEPHTLMPDHMDNLRNEVSASVTAAMVEHGQTPEQLAGAIGMSVGPLWQRLQGLAAFTAEDVVRIARALDVEVGVLLG
ncbi:MAG TPA: helix-turn-helix transcriptional regulator, partial [Dermatophilaceae bacterium]|nr:helix-turn-helix transcriptional regulator [Dermatophilaceae bacterium]